MSLTSQFAELICHKFLVGEEVFFMDHDDGMYVV